MTSNASTKNTSAAAVTTTQTLLPRVTVLATSQTAPTGVEGSSSASSNSGGSELITFAVTQLDAERIVNQQNSGGSLYLSLLSPSSQVSNNDPGVADISTLKPVAVYAK
jgi:Flp pilus assembly protein CpaB